MEQGRHLSEGRQYPGSGLDIVIFKKIVERRGQRIWLGTELGKGSTFYFTISKTGGGK